MIGGVGVLRETHNAEGSALVYINRDGKVNRYLIIYYEPRLWRTQGYQIAKGTHIQSMRIPDIQIAVFICIRIYRNHYMWPRFYKILLLILLTLAPAQPNG